MGLGGVAHLSVFLAGPSHCVVFLKSGHPYSSPFFSEPDQNRQPLSGHHLPACAPPSTCRISPEVKVASVRNKAASTTSFTSPILPTGCNPLRNSWVSGLCMGGF